MKVEARFGVLGDGQTAVIEMAAASGLALLKPQDRDPMAHDDVRHGGADDGGGGDGDVAHHPGNRRQRDD